MRDRAEATVRPPALWGRSSPSASWLCLPRLRPHRGHSFPRVPAEQGTCVTYSKRLLFFPNSHLASFPQADELSGAQMEWCVSPHSQLTTREVLKVRWLSESAQAVRLELDWKHSDPSRMTATSWPWEKGWKEKSPLCVKPSPSWLRLPCVWGFCVDNEFLKYGDPDFLFLSCILFLRIFSV